MASETSTLTKTGDKHLVNREARIGPPGMFHVVLLNDDFTPMDFVVHLLERVFGFAKEDATQVMRRIHVEGRGVCGTYTRDIAMTKAAQAESLARGNEHPLRCTVEPE